MVILIKIIHVSLKTLPLIVLLVSGYNSDIITNYRNRVVVKW